jgi:hypothetical protein
MIHTWSYNQKYGGLYGFFGTGISRLCQRSGTQSRVSRSAAIRTRRRRPEERHPGLIAQSDTRPWLCADHASADLFARSRDLKPDIAVAAVSFIWHLTRRNPYAARLVCGASPQWCEQISEHTLFDLLQRVGADPQILQPRFAGNVGCWQKLLGPGLSSNAGVRESAYLACLQTLLTDTSREPVRRLRTAACNTSIPVLSMTKQKRVT